MTPAIQCVYCMEEGHRARDCPKERINPHACRNCKQEGHNSKECPEPRSAEGVECRKCNKTGHFSRDVSPIKKYLFFSLISSSAPTSKRVPLGLAATVAQRTTLRRNVISRATRISLLVVTAKSRATFRATALSRKIGQRCSARTARSSAIRSRSVRKSTSSVHLLNSYSAARPLLLRETRWVEAVLLRLLVAGEQEMMPLLPLLEVVRLPGTPAVTGKRFITLHISFVYDTGMVL